MTTETQTNTVPPLERTAELPMGELPDLTTAPKTAVDNTRKLSAVEADYNNPWNRTDEYPSAKRQVADAEADYDAQLNGSPEEGVAPSRWTIIKDRYARKGLAIAVAASALFSTGAGGGAEAVYKAFTHHDTNPSASSVPAYTGDLVPPSGFVPELSLPAVAPAAPETTPVMPPPTERPSQQEDQPTTEQPAPKPPLEVTVTPQPPQKIETPVTTQPPAPQPPSSPIEKAPETTNDPVVKNPIQVNQNPQEPQAPFTAPTTGAGNPPVAQ